MGNKHHRNDGTSAVTIFLRPGGPRSIQVPGPVDCEDFEVCPTRPQRPMAFLAFYPMGATRQEYMIVAETPHAPPDSRSTTAARPILVTDPDDGDYQDMIDGLIGPCRPPTGLFVARDRRR